MSQLPKRELNRISKEKRILEGALKVFSETGYSGATMEAIAVEAGVSKPTLYQFFGAKEQLFSAVLTPQREHMLKAFTTPGDTDMVTRLYEFAWKYADFVLRPDMLSLARLVIGEVQRFPEIGPAYQAAGPDQLLRGMMDYLNTLRDEKKLEFEDTELAAQDLWGLILSAPRTQALYMPDNIPDKAAQTRYLNNGLKVFLKAYSTQPDRDLAALKKITANSTTL